VAQFFGEEVGKLKLSPLISLKCEVPGTLIFYAVGGLRVLKNKILASGPTIKWGPEKNNFVFKKFLRN